MEGRGLKKSKLSRRLSKIVHEAVSEDLGTYDMHKWKQACKGFGPIHYVSSTRKVGDSFSRNGEV